MASSTEHDPPASPVTRRYLLTIAYDGAKFHGWQKQHPPGEAPLRTVAGVVEETLQRLVGQPINLYGASRTDAGVHAHGQLAHFDAATRIPVERLAAALTGRLPHDIDIRDARIVADDFDLINAVHSKQYRYRIFNSTTRPLDRRRYVYHNWMQLDIDRMNDAARRLVGTHDFAGFAAAGHGRQTTVRTIFNCAAEQHDDGPEAHIVVEGDGFLYNMVRIISGTLLEVGRGHFEPDIIDKVIETSNRQIAGPTLPPEGLWLEWIKCVGE
jgi:tRNA pseudouridine38-40 synthase